jgi:hypothetical protein
LEPVSREIGDVGGPNGLNPGEGATTGEELRSFGKAAGMSMENRKAQRLVYQDSRVVQARIGITEADKVIHRQVVHL